MASDGKVRPFRYTRGKLSFETTLLIIATTFAWRCATWGFRRCKPALYHPVALGGIATYTLTYLASSWAAAALLWGVVAWAFIHPDSYLRHAAPRTQSFLAGFPYRYRPRAKLGGCSVLREKDPIPTISWVKKTGCITTIRLKMAYGHEINWWREEAARIAQTYNAHQCTINPYRREELLPWRHTMITKPRWLVLDFLTRDPFNTGLGVEYIDYYNKITSQPVVATQRNGEPIEDDLETQTLAIAMTRRGKSNRIRARIYANRHKIQAGELELWMIDGKGGVEGAFLEHLVARHAYGDTELNPNAYHPAEFDRLLKEAVMVLKKRQRNMRGEHRMHIATKKDPWLLIIIDELLVLTSKAVPPDIRNSIAASIRLIQQQGIACGVTLDAATQLAQKELIDFRDGFTKFEIGKVERGVVDMIFGTGWWERGARADEIPDDLPGVFYVKTDATMVPTEIRYPLVTDADLKPLKRARASVLWKPRHLNPVDDPPADEPEDKELESAAIPDSFGGFA